MAVKPSVKRVVLLVLCVAAVVVALALTAVLLFKGDGGGVAEVSRDEYPVWGVDVSAHNGEIDFDRVKADGMDFVIIKATEGGGFKDRRFHSNYTRAKEAGLKVGAYHFFRFDVTGYMQGLNFYHSIKGLDLDLPVVVDLEEWANPRESTTEIVMARLNEFVSYMERHGYRVMVYTNKDGYERFVKYRMDSSPLWIATFTRPEQGVDWQLWQFSHRGKVDGIDSKVDMNVFNGSNKEWRQWIGR